MKKIMFLTVALLLFATSAFAGQACCAKKTCDSVKSNIVFVGLDAPQDDISVVGYTFGFDRLNLFGPDNKIGVGARLTSFGDDGSAMLGSLSLRFYDNLYGIFEIGNRRLDSDDMSVVNGGALLMLSSNAGFKLTAGDKSLAMGIGFGF